MKTRESQANKILKVLQEGRPVTVRDALKICDCERLAARISDLRKLGHKIETIGLKVKSGKTVGQYWLSEFAPNQEKQTA